MKMCGCGGRRSRVTPAQSMTVPGATQVPTPGPSPEEAAVSAEDQTRRSMAAAIANSHSS